MATNNSVNGINGVVQIVSASIGTLVTCNTAMPYDDSIPQNTEGTQVLTISITPKFSTSTLEIMFNSYCAKATAGSGSVALFQDANANALAAKAYALANTQSCSCMLSYSMTSGTTSSTTFSIRIGPAANEVYVNGNSAGGQLMGGVSNTLLTVIEHL